MFVTKIRLDNRDLVSTQMGTLLKILGIGRSIQSRWRPALPKAVHGNEWQATETQWDVVWMDVCTAAMPQAVLYSYCVYVHI